MTNYNIESVNLRCVCTSGFTGINCDTQINYCDLNTCKNGATCLPLVGGCQCICPCGTTGTYCDIGIILMLLDKFYLDF